MSKGQLLAVHPDGRHKLIDNTYAVSYTHLTLPTN